MYIERERGINFCASPQILLLYISSWCWSIWNNSWQFDEVLGISALKVRKYFLHTYVKYFFFHFVPSERFSISHLPRINVIFYWFSIIKKKPHPKLILNLIAVVSETEALRLISLWPWLTGEEISDTDIPLKFLN